MLGSHFLPHHLAADLAVVRGLVFSVPVSAALWVALFCVVSLLIR